MLFKAFAEADKENVDALPVIDGVPKLAEFVHDGLETLAVDAALRSPWTVLRSSVWRVLTRASTLS